jgi:acetyl-CoA acetyltransferase
MDDVVVIGIGMHPMGKFADRDLGDLARHAVWEAIEDAGIDARMIDIAYVANCYHGYFTGQGDAVAPVAIGYSGLSGLPMCHVSGGSAASTVALHQAALAVGSQEYHMALAVGVEKQYVPGDPSRSISAIATSGERVVAMEMGLTWIGEMTMGARRLMERYGWTREDFALVAEKNRYHGSLNPLAEIQQTMSVREILAAREVAYPLTRPMCAGAAVDGAAAAIVCTRETARSRGIHKTARIAAMCLGGTRYARREEADRRPGIPSMNDTAEVFAAAYERACVGPEDLELVQVHDAIAPEELLSYQVLGLCEPGDEPRLLRSGATRLGGRIPVNTDGGLLARGHPIGVTGLAQVHETVLQIRGQAGRRQVRHGARGHFPRVAAVQNAGARGGAAGGVAVSTGFIFTCD